MPDFKFEEELIANGNRVVAGTDEAGRGPLAGPVVAAAVILDTANIPEGMDDSKKLSAKRRDVLFDEICTMSRFAIAQADVEEIDTLNIFHASHLAMRRAVEGLGAIDHVLVDGNKIPAGLTMPATPLVKGDTRSLSIAAASIWQK